MSRTVTQEETFPLTAERKKELEEQLLANCAEIQSLTHDNFLILRKLSENKHGFLQYSRVQYNGKDALVDYNYEAADPKDNTCPLRVKIGGVDGKRPLYRLIHDCDKLEKI